MNKEQRQQCAESLNGGLQELETSLDILKRFADAGTCAKAELIADYVYHNALTCIKEGLTEIVAINRQQIYKAIQSLPNNTNN